MRFLEWGLLLYAVMIRTSENRPLIFVYFVTWCTQPLLAGCGVTVGIHSPVLTRLVEGTRKGTRLPLKSAVCRIGLMRLWWDEHVFAALVKQVECGKIDQRQ